MRIERLVAEYGAPDLGVGTAAPRLSWVRSEGSGSQTASEIRLRAPDGRTEVARRSGPQQVLVAWPFPELRSRERVEVEVRAEAGGEWTAWSDPLVIEAGLLTPEDVEARFVSPRDVGGLDGGAVVLARDLELDGDVVAARLYVTAHGIYDAWIGGRRVGDHQLDPGWTAYDARLRYRTFDVTEHLRSPGADRIAVGLGNGWYRGQLTWTLQRDSYGDRLALLAQLEVTYADGRRQTVVTDESWRAGTTGVLADDLYDGQTTDLRLPLAPDAVAEGPVDVVEADLGRLVAPTGPPVREVATLPAREVSTSPGGAQILDFGQNVVGWVRLRVTGERGARVTVRHAEVLEDGELGVRPLRDAKATDTYLLAGGGAELLEPRYTFHGFRYAEVTGATVRAEDADAVVVSSDLRRTGWFECSEPEVNRLHENVVWGMRGNFVDVPTDCPQRDERLGWTGDIQVFAPTAGFLFDVGGFLGSWLQDLAADQHADGGVPMVVPDVVHENVSGPRPGDQGQTSGAGWADAAVHVPWTLYERYGDVGVLERQYDSMRAWVDKERALAGDSLLWDTGFQFGDWLDPDAPPHDAAAAKADPAVVATAYLARSAHLLARAAGVLGHEADARRYGQLSEDVASAFREAYVGADGTVRSDCQTVYALAIVWGLLDTDAQRRGAGDRLAALVREADFHVSTGFLGTPVILDALCEAGYPELAHAMLLTRTNPSWLYPVSMGATTIWERWDSMLPDGSVNPGEMTSFNHYAYGAVADWLHRSVAGLAPAAPGYREVTVRPLVTGQLDRASARLDSPYGPIEVSWRLAGERFELELEVPPGVTAHLDLPLDEPARTVGPGAHRVAGDWVPVGSPLVTR
ncbi:family 78 glycoside hydrolase catalytic domain [Krasilnikoviella flava]|uniref:alpha-L-rhamnosidase n=1 Tax=Krasilnikoviella flava TaxID=526729 RepID=A0A1T5K922_9MICO|nr:family 78 glycoside hydrolase catalytic domain [Krasilnikoviella flava]SKC60124.1 alpha-L-rhamnosidase [Krasilnikoviella flava]